jgi:hypothetical protein
MFGGVFGWLGGGGRGGSSAACEAVPKAAPANAREARAQPQEYHTGAVHWLDAAEGGVPEPTGSPPRKPKSGELRRSPRQAGAAAARPQHEGKSAGAAARALHEGKSGRVKTELKLGCVRPYFESISAKGAPLLPLGFPTGPWDTREEAKAEIALFCRSPATGGGSHGVVWGQLRQGNEARGPHATLICHAHSAPTDCNWRVTLEQTTDGWTLYSTFGDHSAHKLAKSVEEANVLKAMRDIPSDLVPQAKSMAALQCATSTASAC